jgi:hypothetical protein
VVLQWLMDDPLLTGKQAVQRLERELPDLSAGIQRTLQQRMGEWLIAHGERVVGQQRGQTKRRKTINQSKAW